MANLTCQCDTYPLKEQHYAGSTGEAEKYRNEGKTNSLTASSWVSSWLTPFVFSKSGLLQCRFITLYPAHGAHGVSTLYQVHGAPGMSTLYPAHGAHGVSILYPVHGAHRVSTYATCSHSKCQGLWLYGSLVSYNQPVAREHLQVTGNYVSMVGPLHRNVAPASP